jgi:hypothetical protein
MFDTRKTLHDRGILDVIKILASNGESGRLQMSAGKLEGAFFFRNGQLVDARVGHLTGFQAVNAVASMRDARFDFDPSVNPPLVSSITPSERVVLKQFFGIETVNANDTPAPPAYSADEEVTLETNRIPVEALPDPGPPDPPAPRSLYRSGLILAMLAILIVVAAVALRNRYRERENALQQSAATAQQPVPQPVAEEVKTDSPSTSVDQPAIARDLTGKWNVVNSVQKTSYRSFQNLKIGFEISISQSGKRFTGTGQKISENGRSLPKSSRTPIQVKGAIEGDRAVATFYEDGGLRKSNGRFVWKIDKAGAGLKGTFVSTAAGSSGASAGKRVS